MVNGLNIELPETIDPGVAPATPEDVDAEVEYVVIDEGQSQAGPTDYEAKLAEMEQANQALQAQLEQASVAPPQAQTDPQIASVLEMLAKQNAPQKEEPAKPAFNLEEHFKKLDGNFYTSPSQSAAQAVAPYLQEINDAFSKKAKEQELKIGQLLVMSDPTSREDYNKYRGEVDELVKGMAPSEDTYSKALKMVRANHVDDIVQDKLSERIAELEAKLAAQTANPVMAPTQATYTNATGVKTPAPTARKQVRISPNLERAARHQAKITGSDYNDEFTRNYIIEQLRSRGVK